MKKLQQDLDSFSDREKAFTKEVADLKKEREGIGWIYSDTPE